MERLVTAREYARMTFSNEREATNFERRLQRWASKLPEDQRQMVGKAYALTERQWQTLAAQERPVGRPTKPEPRKP